MPLTKKNIRASAKTQAKGRDTKGKETKGKETKTKVTETKVKEIKGKETKPKTNVKKQPESQDTECNDAFLDKFKSLMKTHFTTKEGQKKECRQNVPEAEDTTSATFHPWFVQLPPKLKVEPEMSTKKKGKKSRNKHNDLVLMSAGVMSSVYAENVPPVPVVKKTYETTYTKVYRKCTSAPVKNQNTNQDTSTKPKAQKEEKNKVSQDTADYVKTGEVIVSSSKPQVEVSVKETLTKTEEKTEQVSQDNGCTNTTPLSVCEEHTAALVTKADVSVEEVSPTSTPKVDAPVAETEVQKEEDHQVPQDNKSSEDCENTADPVKTGEVLSQSKPHVSVKETLSTAEENVEEHQVSQDNVCTDTISAPVSEEHTADQVTKGEVSVEEGLPKSEPQVENTTPTKKKGKRRNKVNNQNTNLNTSVITEGHKEEEVSQSNECCNTAPSVSEEHTANPLKTEEVFVEEVLPTSEPQVDVSVEETLTKTKEITEAEHQVSQDNEQTEDQVTTAEVFVEQGLPTCEPQVQNTSSTKKKGKRRKKVKNQNANTSSKPVGHKEEQHQVSQDNEQTKIIAPEVSEEHTEDQVTTAEEEEERCSSSKIHLFSTTPLLLTEEQQQLSTPEFVSIAEADLQRLIADKEELLKKTQTQAAELEHLRQQVSQTRNYKVKLESVNRQLQETNQAKCKLLQENNKKEAENNTLKAQLNKVTNEEIKNLKTQLHEAQRQKELSLVSHKRELEGALAQWQQEKCSMLKTHQEEKTSLEGQMKHLNARLEEAIIEKEKFSTELDSAQKKLAETTNQGHEKQCAAEPPKAELQQSRDLWENEWEHLNKLVEDLEMESGDCPIPDSEDNDSTEEVEPIPETDERVEPIQNTETTEEDIPISEGDSDDQDTPTVEDNPIPKRDEENNLNKESERFAERVTNSQNKEKCRKKTSLFSRFRSLFKKSPRS